MSGRGGVAGCEPPSGPARIRCLKRLDHRPAGSRWARTPDASPTFVACFCEAGTFVAGAFDAGVRDPAYNRREIRVNVLSAHSFPAHWKWSPERRGILCPKTWTLISSWIPQAAYHVYAFRRQPSTGTRVRVHPITTPNVLYITLPTRYDSGLTSVGGNWPTRAYRRRSMSRW
jgi:hypothetical protein